MLAETSEEQNRILRIRSHIYTALKPDMIDILDVTVPPSMLERLMNQVDEIAAKYGVYLPAYGHAGDGNLHVHIMKEGIEDMEIVKKITGEHGIGKIRTESLSLVLGKKHIEIMKSIKRIFDPNNILNPTSVLP
jgi:glycolate oxidase